MPRSAPCAAHRRPCRPAGDAVDVAARLALKARQLTIASREATLPDARCTAARATLVPGTTIGMTVAPGPGASGGGAPEGVVTAVAAPPGFTVAPGDDGGFRVTAPADAGFTSPYRFAVPVDAPASPIHGLLRYARDDVAVEVPVDASPCIAVVPPASLSASTPAVPWNLEAPPTPIIELALQASPGAHDVAVAAPAAWPVGAPAATTTPDGAPAQTLSLAVPPPRDAAEQDATLRFTVDGAPAQSMTRITHPRLGSAIVVQPAAVALRSLRVRLPVRANGPGAHRLCRWRLRQELALAAPDRARDRAGSRLRLRALASYDTLVVGVFAFRTRPALRAALGTIKAWMHAGGHLVTLYHRPQDGWDPDQVPAHRLRIGQPSVRWRVCDPASTGDDARPEHPLLSRPNVIDAADWSGWVRERGLYFAAEWAPVYTPLLALADPARRRSPAACSLRTPGPAATRMSALRCITSCRR
jgi:hypothetical protein